MANEPMSELIIEKFKDVRNFPQEGGGIPSIRGDYLSIEGDLSDTPVNIDVLTTLGRKGHDGYIRNDGDEDITINLDTTDTGYGNDITLKKGEVFSLTSLTVYAIKLVSTDASYRVFVV